MRWYTCVIVLCLLSSFCTAVAASCSRLSVSLAIQLESSCLPARSWLHAGMRLRGGTAAEDHDKKDAQAVASAGAWSLTEVRNRAVEEVMAELFDSANAGNTTAMCLLGCLQSQCSDRKDEVLAFRCFLSAAQKGNVVAQYNLGLCYSEGRGVRQDQIKATKWYRSAADAGDVEALRLMAIRLNDGRGCDTSLQAATAAFVRAAEAGDSSSEFNLGVRYASAHGIPSLSGAHAGTFFLGGGARGVVTNKGGVGAGSRAGDLEDALSHLDNDSSGEDETRDPALIRVAVEWYTRAAHKGHCKAMYNLAQLLDKNGGCPGSGGDNDAGLWLQKASERKYARAQYALARALARDAAHLRASGRKAVAAGAVGSGDPRRGQVGQGSETGEHEAHAQRARQIEEESARWLHAAASQGYGKALYALGLQHAEGRDGVPKNLTAALGFFLGAHDANLQGAWLRYEACNRSLAWQKFPEQLRAEQRALAARARRALKLRRAAKKAAESMWFPLARDQKSSRALVAAAMAQADEARRLSQMPDMHSALTACRKRMACEGLRGKAAAKAVSALEAKSHAVVNVDEALGSTSLTQSLQQVQPDAQQRRWTQHVDVDVGIRTAGHVANHGASALPAERDALRAAMGTLRGRAQTRGEDSKGSLNLDAQMKQALAKTLATVAPTDAGAQRMLNVLRPMPSHDAFVAAVGRDEAARRVGGEGGGDTRRMGGGASPKTGGQGRGVHAREASLAALDNYVDVNALD